MSKHSCRPKYVMPVRNKCSVAPKFSPTSSMAENQCSEAVPHLQCSPLLSSDEFGSSVPVPHFKCDISKCSIRGNTVNRVFRTSEVNTHLTELSSLATSTREVY